MYTNCKLRDAEGQLFLLLSLSLVCTGVELRRVKSLLFCHVEYLDESKCRKLPPDVAAIVIIHILTLSQFIIFLLSDLSVTN